MKSYIAFPIFMMLIGCSTGEKSVNKQNYYPPVTPLGLMISTDKEPLSGQLPPAPSISGKVVTANLFSSPLQNINIKIMQLQDGKESTFSETSSGSDGSFQVTRATPKGHYIVRIVDKKYSGELKVDIVDKPMINLLLEVRLKQQ